jgi:hypothetical protein
VCHSFKIGSGGVFQNSPAPKPLLLRILPLASRSLHRFWKFEGMLCARIVPACFHQFQDKYIGRLRGRSCRPVVLRGFECPGRLESFSLLQKSSRLMCRQRAFLRHSLEPLIGRLMQGAGLEVSFHFNCLLFAYFGNSGTVTIAIPKPDVCKSLYS